MGSSTREFLGLRPHEQSVGHVTRALAGRAVGLPRSWPRMKKPRGAGIGHWRGPFASRRRCARQVRRQRSSTYGPSRASASSRLPPRARSDRPLHRNRARFRPAAQRHLRPRSLGFHLSLNEPGAGLWRHGVLDGFARHPPRPAARVFPSGWCRSRRVDQRGLRIRIKQYEGARRRDRRGLAAAHRANLRSASIISSPPLARLRPISRVSMARRYGHRTRRRSERPARLRHQTDA